MGFFEKLKGSIKKTKDALMGRIDTVMQSFVKIDEDMLEELEETLITADVGVDTTMEILDRLRAKIKSERLTEAHEAKAALRSIIAEMIGEGEPLNLENRPAVILVIGVNGVGKTTSVGKIAASLIREGKSVVIAAADTFRAAAIDQLEVWCNRAGAVMIRQNEGGDPAAVVFDAAAAARKRGADVLIVDTAGRLHNKKNLMDELAKINRVLSRELPDSSRETLLVLDATTGQNAVLQAKEFKNAAEITGLVLTKLDGTAKGGIVISIKGELGIPVKYIGVGEGIDDMEPFVCEDFVKALFDEDEGGEE